VADAEAGRGRGGKAQSRNDRRCATPYNTAHTVHSDAVPCAVRMSILYPWLLACSTAHSEGTAKSVLMRSDGDTRLPSPPASPAFQASFNEQIKHIIRKLHAEFFVQPQQQQDKSLCGMIEQQMIFARPIDQIPDFDRPVVRSRHNLGPVRGERHRPDPVAVGVRLLAQQPQRGCQTSQQASVLDKEGRF
jgi:hypothetical protein